MHGQMMAYRQSAKDTNQLTPKQATGHTLQIVTTIQTTQAEAMAAIMNINLPITTITMTMISTQEVITMEIITVAIIITITKTQKNKTNSLGA